MALLSRTDRSSLANWWWTVDRLSLAAVATLIVAGLLMALAASPAVAGRIGLEPFHFFYRQLSFLAPAFITIVLVSAVSPRNIRRLALAAFVLSTVAIVATLIVGPEVKGAHRWLWLGPLSIQPSEFVKPAFVVLAAALMAEANRSPGFPGIMLAGSLFVFVAGLLVMQPDFGQTMLLGLAFGAMLFLAGLGWQWIAACGVLGASMGVGAYFLAPHVASRIDRFLHPDKGDTFQVNTALNAFAEGGVTGVGPGEGTVKFVLPDAHTDFVFAVAGEEFGLAACALLIMLFAFVVWRALKRAQQESDHFIQLAASGLAVLFGLQAVINIAVSLNLMPAKGMTLPFVSYGGSSALALALTVGMLLALTRRRLPGYRG